MAELPHRRHGNFPQRRTTLLPQGAKRRVQLPRMAKSPETGSNLATTTAEPSVPGEPLGSTRFCGVEMEPNGCWRGTETETSERPLRRPTLPEKGVSALLKRIRIHPQAQRILGNSCIAIVQLERLRIQVAPHRSVCLSALQPVVSLVRLACRPRPECHGEVPRLDPPLQNGSNQTETDSSDIGEASSPARPAGSFDFSPETKATSWTEPYCPDSSPSVAQEPEQDSGFDCESNPDPPYILFESESEWDPDMKNDSESFYLDPDPNIVIQLDPEPDSSLLESGENTSLELHYEPESKCEVEIVHSDDNGDQSGRCSPSQQDPDLPSQQDLDLPSQQDPDLPSQQDPDLPSQQDPDLPSQQDPDLPSQQDPDLPSQQDPDLPSQQDLDLPTQQDPDLPSQQDPDLPSQQDTDLPSQQPEPEAGIEERESEDFCGVCLNGGDLLCCDRCPKVYHLACHIPPLISFPLGDWVCTLCRTDQDPVEAYDRDNMLSCGGIKAPYTLSNQDQRRCEQLTLLLSCHILSAPFHEPVSPLARNYYQIIKRPIDLSVIRRKLDKSNTLHYFTAEQFVDDVLLMFKNCATFNYPDSEVAQAGRSLEVFFLGKLEEVFPDRTFPMASQDRTDRARLQWLNRKRKENYRKKRYVFSGKKYCL